MPVRNADPTELHAHHRIFPKRLFPPPTGAVVGFGSGYTCRRKSTEKIGVFVDASFEEIAATVEAAGLTGVQLHFNAAPGDQQWHGGAGQQRRPRHGLFRGTGVGGRGLLQDHVGVGAAHAE